MPSNTFMRKSSSASALCPKNAAWRKTEVQWPWRWTVNYNSWTFAGPYKSEWLVLGGSEWCADTTDSPERAERTATGRWRESPCPKTHVHVSITSTGSGWDVSVRWRTYLDLQRGWLKGGWKRMISHFQFWIKNLQHKSNKHKICVALLEGLRITNNAFQGD